MTNFKADLNLCKEHENIMEVIESELSDKKLSYKLASKYEIVIYNSSKKEVFDIISSLFPKKITGLMLSICECGNVYVRQILR